MKIAINLKLVKTIFISFFITSLFISKTLIAQTSDFPFKKYEKIVNVADGKRLFNIYNQNGRIYLEIADSLIGRYLMVVSKITRTPAVLFDLDLANSGGLLTFAGDPINSNVIVFEKNESGNILLKNILFTQRSSDSSRNGMFISLNNSNLQSIIAAFDIKALTKDKDGVIIDLTDYIKSDNSLFYFSQSKKDDLKLGAFQVDKSYVNYIRVKTNAIELRTTKTYNYKSTGSATFEINTSLFLLSGESMRPRFADKRVGFYAIDFAHFDGNPNGYKRDRIITRWRLEPKIEDKPKFENGQLVEPQKPIIFYIDPATPQKWIPFIKKGVNDWQPIFERIGFKSAIVAKMPPTKDEDSTWSIFDGNVSVILYQASTTENSLFWNVVDPRSGEIISSSIRLYHGMLQSLNDRYIIQASPSDQAGRTLKVDQEIIGKWISSTVSHEVGHALGLQHNFIASYCTPVEKLRDKNWVETFGHTVSIMDYARCNYVAQPEDNIGIKGHLQRIGEYDKWAIEWGYKLIKGAKSSEDEMFELNKLTDKKISDKRNWFVLGEKYPNYDPRAQAEDLGNDLIKSSTYGINNLHYVINNLHKWLDLESSIHEDCKRLYTKIIDQFSNYISHVGNYIGGIYSNYNEIDLIRHSGNYVPTYLQKAAVQFIAKELFETPSWLFKKELLDITGDNKTKLIDKLQNIALQGLFRPSKLANMLLAHESRVGDIYEIEEYFDDLRRHIWSELYINKPIDIYRRNLQIRYIECLSRLSNMQKLDATQLQIPAYAVAELDFLKTTINRKIHSMYDRSTCAFLRYCTMLINKSTDRYLENEIIK